MSCMAACSPKARQVPVVGNPSSLRSRLVEDGLVPAVLALHARHEPVQQLKRRRGGPDVEQAAVEDEHPHAVRVARPARGGEDASECSSYSVRLQLACVISAYAAWIRNGAQHDVRSHMRCQLSVE